LNEKVGNRKPDEADQALGRELKAELGKLEPRIKETDEHFRELLKNVPNMPLEDVPVGLSEDENVVAKTVGIPREFEFKPKAHQEIGEKLGLIDKTRAAKISGSRFVYLKGDLVRLQLALMNFVMSQLTDTELIGKLISENSLDVPTRVFTPVLPPALIKTEPYQASSRLNAEETTYKLVQDDLWLNASAEHSLCTMYWDEVIAEVDLPIRYIGYSTSFRREAGSYGKDVEGIFRMHQFDKLEMEVFSTAETGLEEHKLLVAIQEHLVRSLNLPYQLIQKCTFDIGKPNAGGVDINTWFPAQANFRETHTADYMTDYQARDLSIRVKRSDGSLELVHTNDATAFAMGRILAAIIENYQDESGHIEVPAALVQYMGGQTRI
jgi:seryl-tRNA synthetase